MAGTIERFRIKSRGAEALLKSPGVRADLERRAQAVAGQAGPLFEQALAQSGTPEPVRMVADSYTGRTRAGATAIAVHPGSLRVEREHGYFRAAMSAAAN
ncbi:hypothetical protein PV729_26555 [Streptomyces europaeiscabiei]|uniref:Uncharacterized protein n=1 Tax=Streptomyces europaeiscabiei TaxID=146819 RepID=A0ABU4NT71_9ACTN|nr:hypothetical protein [Streptomyces europaeiscabiei]MDX3555284.1 hypothetical protein [Streptomyces europaeiscabiei]MDX3705298.1 hypothetical protein [Streptomyces europaeiscabiei]